MRETVPDQVVDEATEIELVDLPPEELLARLREGKVYVPDQASRAVERFFRPGNLSALREMALRRTAQQVDAQMLSYMQTQAIPGPWSAGERLLVAVGPSPLSRPSRTHGQAARRRDQGGVAGALRGDSRYRRARGSGQGGPPQPQPSPSASEPRSSPCRGHPFPTRWWTTRSGTT